jgi:hypothetical protein
MFRSRARRLPNGDLMPMKDVPGIEALTTHGAHVTCTGEPQVFLDDMFYLTGEVPRVTPFERGLAAHFQKTANGNWIPDPLLIDERFLMVNVEGKRSDSVYGMLAARGAELIEARLRVYWRCTDPCSDGRFPSCRNQRGNHT